MRTPGPDNGTRSLLRGMFFGLLLSLPFYALLWAVLR